MCAREIGTTLELLRTGSINRKGMLNEAHMENWCHFIYLGLRESVPEAAAEQAEAAAQEDPGASPAPWGSLSAQRLSSFSRTIHDSVIDGRKTPRCWDWADIQEMHAWH